MRRIRLTLPLLILACFVTPAAAAAGMEVCDAPPRYGVGATAAAIVRTACHEHRLWFRPFIGTDGRLVALGVTEAERARLFDGVTPAWQQVVRYWRESGTLSSLASTPGATSCMYAGGGRDVENDCRAFILDNPWSAAFVSWVMARAPLHGFGGSPRHLDYIARAWRDPEGSPYSYADPFAGKPAPGDLLCFLRANDHGVGAQGLRQALSGHGRMPTRSHCEIVVAANFGGDRTLYLIGGNVLNSVVMRKLPLDAGGRLLPGAADAAIAGAGELAGPGATAARTAPVAGTAAASNRAGAGAGDAPAAEDSATPADTADCRPANAAACDFNRRDWAVLLKLKPQSQLGAPAYPSAPPATPQAAASGVSAPATRPR
jgi:hypothetical protein